MYGLHCTDFHENHSCSIPLREPVPKIPVGLRSMESTGRNSLRTYLNHGCRSEHFQLTDAGWTFCKGLQYRILRRRDVSSSSQSLIQGRRRARKERRGLHMRHYFYVLKIRQF